MLKIYISRTDRKSQVRGHSHMTSALRGEGGLSEKQTIVLIGCVSGTVTRGEGVRKSQNFADVICEQPLRQCFGLCSADL